MCKYGVIISFYLWQHFAFYFMVTYLFHRHTESNSMNLFNLMKELWKNSIGNIGIRGFCT